MINQAMPNGETENARVLAIAPMRRRSSMGKRMDLKDRFFGKGTPKLGEPPVANNRLAKPPAFAILFSDVPDINPDALAHILRDYHTDFAGVTAEFVREGANTLGLIGWGRHVVKVVVFNTAMPTEAVVNCVQPAHYDPQLKQEAYQHKAHALLFYAGYETDSLEQHVALAATAAGLTHFGGLVVLNELGHSSMPALALLPHEEDNRDTIGSLRKFPIPLLYAGFVKIELDGEPGVWMRTYGCEALQLPNLAIHADAHNQGGATFSLFANILAHLREKGKSFQPGDTIALGEGMYLHVRVRTQDEWFLESEGTMLVLERTTEAEATT
ncbi:MAG: hypothetical protein C0467_18905 [Planctomycetaceae bacterium]|nr:hypothetical protein [Planctomycetaceae bacterium]